MSDKEQERCQRCNGEMREGQALQNTISTGIPDFPGATDLAGQTFSFTGPAKMVRVLKCVDCGYSRSLKGEA